MDFDKLFSSFKDIKVAVIGDVMLDTYWWGTGASGDILSTLPHQ